MKTCTNTPALLLLLGLSVVPTATTAQTPVHNEQAALAPTAEAEATALEEDKGGWVFGGSVGLDFCSKQLTYGLIDNPHPILTPSAALRFGHEDGFTAEVGVEAIFDTTNWGAKDGGYNNRRWKYQELAPGITLSRTWDATDWLGSALDTSLNYTYEYHPTACKKTDAGFANPNTQWLNFEISAGDFWLQPTLAVEYQLMRQGAKDEDNGKGGLYATFSLAHDFDVGAMIGLDEGALTLTPTLGVGMANKKRNLCDFGENETFMLRDGFGLLELAWSPREGFAITPYVGFSQQLDSNAKDAVGDDDFVAYGGIGVSCEF